MKFLFTFLFFIPLTIFSQNSDSTKTRSHYFPVGIIFSPDVDYRFLKSDESVKWIADERNSFEIPKFGYTVGFDFFLHIKNFGFESGLEFSDMGEQTKKRELIWAQPDPSLPTKVSSVYHYHYLAIPLKKDFMFARINKVSLKFMKRILRGKIPTSDFGLIASIGISTTIFINQKAVTQFEYSDGHTSKIHGSQQGLSRVNFAALGGLGIDYQFTTRLRIKLELVYRQSVTPIASAPIKEYPFSVGSVLEIYYFL
jgi:hypothetical protein